MSNVMMKWMGSALTVFVTQHIYKEPQLSFSGLFQKYISINIAASEQIQIKQSPLKVKLENYFLNYFSIPLKYFFLLFPRSK